jgi:hypothetical protein
MAGSSWRWRDYGETVAEAAGAGKPTPGDQPAEGSEDRSRKDR